MVCLESLDMQLKIVIFRVFDNKIRSFFFYSFLRSSHEVFSSFFMFFHLNLRLLSQQCTLGNSDILTRIDQYIQCAKDIRYISNIPSNQPNTLHDHFCQKWRNFIFFILLDLCSILEYSFSNKQEAVRRFSIYFRKTNSDMQFWCFNCSKITLSNAGIKCQYCGSEAIEEMRDQNNPAQYIPFNVPAQPQPEPQQLDGQEERTFFTISIIRPMSLIMPPFLPMAPLTFIRFISLADQEDQSTPVADEKYEQLEKVTTLQSDCAVCQERSGSGVKLGCKHEFHEDCIKPWFKNANTCPCCRATV